MAISEMFDRDDSTLFLPGASRLSRGELESRRRQALARLYACEVCPRCCRVNRLRDQQAVCRTGRYAAVSSWFPHRGEENCLRGRRGSGTIFFTHCNLRCVFCQNSDISQAPVHPGEALVTGEEIAGIMLTLQRMGCHNVNFVTPEHVVPQVVEAIVQAVRGGFRLPIVYNTSAYDSLESLHLLAGLVDIYMPDFKFWSEDRSRIYLKARDYPGVARAAITEMHRQVGELRINRYGIATRGLLIRHLVMPGYLDETRSILEWIAKTIGTGTYLNLMNQYHPSGRVLEGRYPELSRRVSAAEWRDARLAAAELGLHRLDS